MAVDPLDDNDDLSIEDEQRLIELLDAFESQWRRGANPQIDEWLERVEPRLRPALARDLRRMTAELHGTAQTIAAVRGPAESRVDVGGGGQVSMLAETSELLRIRLRAAAIIVCAAVGLFFLRSVMFPDWRLIAIRAGAVLIAGWIVWTIRAGGRPSLHSLRWTELLLLTVVAAHTIALQASEMIDGAVKDDAVAVNASMLFAYATWCVVNMAYGVLLPNTWRRATGILVLTAATPFVLTWVVGAVEPRTQAFIREELRYAGALLTFVATGAAIACSYTMHHLRRQLMRAKRFGQYRLVKQLGRGGMGEVYLAEHQLLKRPSAIKLIRPGLDTNEEAILRFEREVQATAALTHWNTVQIFDYGRTDDGAFYYVMELLEGSSLQDLVETHGPLPSGRVAYLLRQVCAALRESHAAGLIHRDIKPANIFAAQCGTQGDVVKLLDFGLVRELHAPDSPTDPATARRFEGTPRFMSPEQAQLEVDVDPRSDIYSLGATAYFLLTGHAPFEMKTLRQCIDAHLHQEPEPPSTRGVSLDPELERIVLRCLAKRPEQRFESAAELAEALSQCRCVSDWNDEHARRWWETQALPTK